LTSIMVVDWLI